MPGAVGLKLDIEVGVLGVGDLEGWRVGGVIQEMPGNVPAVQRLPHLHNVIYTPLRSGTPTHILLCH